ncbi:pyridoxamine 5'-phosphate oxidase [Streptomyces huiliensis]|uniref:pyridoxamine 5'-phosphate oxidase n=1 Tax=Streptomyces huiliensis TaxID=2876027 RepID=UPI001CBB1C6B|nr:pyridoxamine 5'-phosphate oxidase [Streptomyces huiliensis]MBZ4323170.1 pyridoxamine 5'-phosphate oxidase [Streptomyces huiliensis]
MTETQTGPVAGPPPEIRAALGAHTTLTLAYGDDEGPQACAVLYAVRNGPPYAPGSPGGRGEGEEGEGNDGGISLVFVTSTTTRHGRFLASGNVRVAFTAQRDGQEWTALTGVQGRGTCHLLDGADRAAAWDAYRTRFPYVERSERLRRALDRTEFWELRPDWLRLVDNGRGFGHRTEWRR